MAHYHFQGQPGTGVDEALMLDAIDAMNEGAGVLYLDPHGYQTDVLLHHVPKDRTADVILFDPSREDDVLPYNPLDSDGSPRRIARLQAEAIKESAGYGGGVTPLMDLVLSNALATLIEAGEPFLGLPFLLTNKTYRQKILLKVKDPVVLSFWKWIDAQPRDELQLTASAFNKALMLIFDDNLRATLAYKTSAFKLTDIVKDKIFFACLRQGSLTPETVQTFGTLLLSQFNQAFMRRDPATPFYVYLPDCYLWAPSLLKDMLTNLDRYNVHLRVSHAYENQFTDKSVYPAITGNCEKRILFRISTEDAKAVVDRHGKMTPDRFSTLGYGEYRFFPVDSEILPRQLSPFPTPSFAKSLDRILYRRKGQAKPRRDAERVIAEFMGGL